MKTKEKLRHANKILHPKTNLAKPADAKPGEKTLATQRHEQRHNINANEKEFRSALKKLIEEIENRLIDSAFSLEGGFGSVDHDVMSTLEPLFEPGIPFERKFLVEGFGEGQTPPGRRSYQFGGASTQDVF
jgi:hypothetical protein